MSRSRIKRVSALKPEPIKTPGSRYAVEHGCKCSPFTNNYGQGTNLHSSPQSTRFSIAPGCPMHSTEYELPEVFDKYGNPIDGSSPPIAASRTAVVTDRGSAWRKAEQVVRSGMTNNEGAREVKAVTYVVRPGDIWRKKGPCDWVEVVRVQLPDCPNYDGGLPGCSVRFSTGRGGWERKTWFYAAANAEDFKRRMAAENRMHLQQERTDADVHSS